VSARRNAALLQIKVTFYSLLFLPVLPAVLGFLFDSVGSIFSF
jgi:hypothetical protein